MTSQPNIVLLVADDHRFDAFGEGGDSAVATPILDQLAHDGVHFHRAYCQGGLVSAICAPSRACLMTGKDLFHATVNNTGEDNDRLTTIRPGIATLPATLRAHGYHTHAVGKWHNDRETFSAGFDSGAALFFRGMGDHWAVMVHDFDPTGTYPTSNAKLANEFSSELFASTAIEFLQSYKEEKPFFLYVAFTAPHDPRTPPKSYDAMYDPDDISLPPNFLPTPTFDNGSLYGRDNQLTPLPRSPQTVRREIASYYGMISHLDEQVGRIVEAVDATNRRHNTTIIYVSDHGLAVGQHGMLGKQNMYDHSVRIPLIIADPTFPGGKKIDALCELSDIFPTVCDLAGITVPATVEGHSLVPVVTGELDQVREYIFGAYRDLQRMVTNGRYKLIRSSRTPHPVPYRHNYKGEGTDHEEFFDLTVDPWERRDMSTHPQYSEVLASLSAALEEWQQRVGDPLYH